MAYFKIEKNKRGELVAKIQASGKNPKTGENSVFSKRVYNTDNLSEAKFRRLVERTAREFEDEIRDAYEKGNVQVRTRVPTFPELMSEWKDGVKKTLSYSYYLRADDTEKKFNAFLKEQRLYKSPVSEIKVRDIQLFLNQYLTGTYEKSETSRMKKDFAPFVNLRALEREGIISRNASYNLRFKEASIRTEAAERMCEKYRLKFDDYFERNVTVGQYSVETVKGLRRILRTVFNEALRYEWIQKNPVVGTKLNAGNSNVSLKPIKEKEVFNMREAQDFLRRLDELPGDMNYKRIPLKFMLLTGVRIAEMNGLRWSDIDYEKRVVHIRRNRLYAKELGYYEKDPKTKNSIRDIPLPDALLKDLLEFEKWFKLSDDDFDLKKDEYYVASNIYRQPVGECTITQWLKKYEKAWGTKDISCHGLRHTYCSLLLSQNVPIQTVSRYMGHSDSTITLKVYSHFIPDTKSQVVYVLDNLTESKADE
ncbi:MAG: site-specific integrase [Clostridia bacterium]|nr:site-specific integrase [Clostridia bacterium]